MFPDVKLGMFYLKVMFFCTLNAFGQSSNDASRVRIFHYPIALQKGLNAGKFPVIRRNSDGKEKLRKEIVRIAKDAKGIVGVAVLNLEDRDSLTYNGLQKLPMLSVLKFPVAITVLHLLDQGKFNIDQRIHISKADLPETYSPLRDKYPEGNKDLSLGELLSYMISLSDNDVCDIMLSKVTSKEEVENYMHSLGIVGIHFGATETEMRANWNAQYTDWARPVDLLKLLDLTWNGRRLTKSSRDLLWKIMTETVTAPGRIKGLLPAGTPVAHKTGSSSTSAMGLTPATNDIGVISLPNGKHVAIVLMICNSTADMDTRDVVIARIAKAVYDFYSN